MFERGGGSSGRGKGSRRGGSHGGGSSGRVGQGGGSHGSGDLGSQGFPPDVEISEVPPGFEGVIPRPKTTTEREQLFGQQSPQQIGTPPHTSNVFQQDPEFPPGFEGVVPPPLTTTFNYPPTMNTRLQGTLLGQQFPQQIGMSLYTSESQAELSAGQEVIKNALLRVFRPDEPPKKKPTKLTKGSNLPKRSNRKHSLGTSSRHKQRKGKGMEDEEIGEEIEDDNQPKFHEEKDPSSDEGTGKAKLLSHFTQ